MTLWIDETARDLRLAARMLSRQKAFSAAAIATLAIGIGANTAIFSVVDGVLLRPLPYSQASRLVRVWAANPRGIARNSVSPPDFFDWRDQAPGFAGLAAFVDADVTLTGYGDASRIVGADATSNLAGVLGVTPIAGRWISDEETRGDGQPVVVISEALWRERLGGRSDIVGRALTLDGKVRTVVGVMPKSFRFPTGDDQLWMPLADSSRAESRSAHYLEVVGRLADGVTAQAAAEGLKAVAGRLASAYPESNRGWSTTVASLRDGEVGSVRTPLLILLAAVAAVLLIACANVAGLMLARSIGRSRELAVRAALGATAGRLMRAHIVEALLLSLLGGAAGVLLAALGPPNPSRRRRSRSAPDSIEWRSTDGCSPSPSASR